MIICHTHKFIFIKTRKTAGTSIEGALAQLCGPDDIITSDGDLKTQQDFYVKEARNYEGSFNPIRELRYQSDLLGPIRVLRDWRERPRFYNHMAASSVMARIDPDIWSNYYKFCFERNPWDKIVSYFYFVHRKIEPEVSISEYVLNKPALTTIDQHFATDWKRYTVRNQIVVDDVFDFSDIEGGLRAALERSNVPVDTLSAVQLPRLKSGTRKSKGSLTQAAAERVAKVFAREIDHFRYEIPEGMVLQDA